MLRRLLAKRPADRYQTPADLLKDLITLKDGGSPTGRRALQLGLLDDGDPSASARTAVIPSAKTKAAKSGPRRSPGGKSRTTDPARRRPASRARLWCILGGVAAVLLAAAAVGLALALRSHPSSSYADQALHYSPPPVGPSANPPPAPGEARPPDQPPPDQPPDKPPAKPRWPALDPTAAPVDAVALRKEIEAPWAALAAPPTDAAVFYVARASAAPAPAYPSLAAAAAAAAAAPADKPVVLEIDDDGPLFETSTAFADRKVTIRAGRGFRPLLVWDAPRTLEERRRKEPGKADDGRPPPFLGVERGALRLENLDVVFKQPESVPGGLALLDLRDGDLTAEGCTFSLAGNPREGVVLARVRGTRPESGRCRFTRCVARGPALIALDLDAAAGAVLFDRSLVVGGEPALLQVRAADSRPLSLTVVRSTLVCDRTLLNVQRAAETDRRPSLQWLGWDSLLSRSSDQPGGDMVSMAAGDGVNTTGVKWRATNCLYAGWQNLLTGPETLAGADTAQWRAHWERSEGDSAVRDAWPVYNEDPSVLPASAYRTADTPVGFAATAAPDGPLGCDLADLPPTRDNWPSLTVESFVVPPIDAVSDDAAPAVPPALDGLYHGGPVDFTRTPDVGAFLADLARKKLLAPRVVLLLSGAGEHPITPFRLQRCTLVLHADAPAQGAAPLTLTWGGQGSVGQEGLIEIEKGGLEMTNIAVKLADFPRAATPAYLLKVHGSLKLFRCRLEGPLQNAADPYRAVVSLEGSGDPAACVAAVNESVLLSGATVWRCAASASAFCCGKACSSQATTRFISTPARTAPFGRTSSACSNAPRSPPAGRSSGWRTLPRRPALRRRGRRWCGAGNAPISIRLGIKPPRRRCWIPRSRPWRTACSSGRATATRSENG